MMSVDKSVLVSLLKLHDDNYNDKNHSSVKGGGSHNELQYHQYGLYIKIVLNEEDKTITVAISGTTCFSENIAPAMYAYSSMTTMQYISNTLLDYAACMIGSGFKLLFMGQGSEHSINWHMDHVIDCGYDWISNGLHFIGKEPLQVEPALSFVKSVLQDIPNLGDYKVIISGHSLGAVISDVINAYLAAEGYSVFGVNFESPGSGGVMQFLIEKLGVNPELVNSINYQMPNNLFNNFNEQFGKVYKSDMCGSGAECHNVNSIKQAIEADSIIQVAKNDLQGSWFGLYPGDVAKIASVVTESVALYYGTPIVESAVLYTANTAWPVLAFIGDSVSTSLVTSASNLFQAALDQYKAVKIVNAYKYITVLNDYSAVMDQLEKEVYEVLIEEVLSAALELSPATTIESAATIESAFSIQMPEATHKASYNDAGFIIRRDSPRYRAVDKLDELKNTNKGGSCATTGESEAHYKIDSGESSWASCDFRGSELGSVSDNEGSALDDFSGVDGYESS